MLRLRPYKASDAAKIVTWCENERSFRLWSSDRYESFPISASDMNNKYFDWNGDCVESDNFYPLTAVNEKKEIIGHLIMRYINGNPETIRMGWVIIDRKLRGLGYGKEMLQLSLKYAFEILKAGKVSIGVFDCNTPAYNCYLSCGFKDVAVDQPEIYAFNKEKWTVVELEITKAEYESRNSRKSIFADKNTSKIKENGLLPFKIKR